MFNKDFTKGGECMIKKWISFFLAIVMALGLVACGTKNDKAKENAAEETKKETTLGDITGKWECVDFLMSNDGSEEMDAQELENMTGINMIEMYSFQAWENGYCALTAQSSADLDESAEPIVAWFTWTKEEEQYTLQYTSEVPAEVEKLYPSGEDTTDTDSADTDAGTDSSEEDEVAELMGTQTITAFFEDEQLVLHTETNGAVNGEEVKGYEEMVFQYAGKNEARQTEARRCYCI
jgi:hypothetical protein